VTQPASSRFLAAGAARRGLLALGLAGAVLLADAARAQRAWADIVAFEDIEFRGRSLRIGGPVPDLRRFGFDDLISSIRVFEGAWELCERTNFAGHCIVIDRDVYDLRRLGMNDVIRSIRPLRWRGRSGEDEDGRRRDWGK
jgi:hypothetical protein